MGNGTVAADRHSYDFLRKVADHYLQNHPEFAGPPVDVEKIVELKEGIDIAPLPCIQSECDVDAFIGCDCRTIYVDDRVYLSTNQHRFRYSLAHELAHKILHRKIFESLQFDSITSWKVAYRGIDSDQLQWIEYQAYALGGLLLVPTKELKKRYGAAARGVAGDGDGDLPELDDLQLYSVEERLSKEFWVSMEVVQRRCQKEGFQVSGG